MLSDPLVSRLASAPWFRAPWSPYSLMDSELQIRAVNEAFARSSQQRAEQLVGRHAFDAFPDNPADPTTDFVADARGSIEHVLRTGTRHWLGVGRYDVPDPHRPGAFVYKVWMPVNSPVTENGRVVGVLHHAQDLTAIVRAPARTGRVTSPLPHELASAVDSLQGEFPTAHPHTVLGLLTDSQRILMQATRHANPRVAVQLARLRLEVRTGRPALSADPPP